MREAGLQAVDHVRSGKGPIIMEFQTYRFRGHSMSDPAKYRTKEELDAYRDERDPLVTLRALLEEQGVSEDTFKTIEKDVKKVVNESKKLGFTEEKRVEYIHFK